MSVNDISSSAEPVVAVANVREILPQHSPSYFDGARRFYDGYGHENGAARAPYCHHFHSLRYEPQLLFLSSLTYSESVPKATTTSDKSKIGSEKST